MDHATVILVSTALLVSLALASGQYADRPGVRDQGSDIPQDISRLLLKNMRFRDVEGVASPDEEENLSAASYTQYSPDDAARKLSQLQSLLRMAKRPSSKTKRERNLSLMNNLAEMLSGNRERDSGSALRMPSLRFG